LKAPLRCIQDPCTCHIILDPASIPHPSNMPNMTGTPGSSLPSGFPPPPGSNGNFSIKFSSTSVGLPPAVPPGFPLPPGFNNNHSQTAQS
jgi:hypothetical protein